MNRIVSVEHVVGYVLRIGFDDGLVRDVDLGPILVGELFGPLRDSAMFAAVRVDPESHTIVWPNGADFDPSILHDWPEHAQAFAAAARRWSPVATAPRGN